MFGIRKFLKRWRMAPVAKPAPRPAAGFDVAKFDIAKFDDVPEPEPFKWDQGVAWDSGAAWDPEVKP